MKLSEIAEELAKLNESEQDAGELDDEAEKAEFEKLLMENPQIDDDMALDLVRGIDHVTAVARAECRRLGIGDFAPHRLNKTKPEVIPEELDEVETWMRQVLEKRRAWMSANQLPTQRPAPTPAPQHRIRWFRPPRRHGLYAALDDD